MMHTDCIGGGGAGNAVAELPPAQSPALFIKCLKVETHFATEVAVLSRLNGLPGVVQLIAVDSARLAFAASPVCKKLGAYREKCVIFRMAVELVSTFGKVHRIGFAHRDARSGNFLVEMTADGRAGRAVVCDWATAVRLDGEAVPYQGAVHFAADCVLQNLH